MRSQQQIEQTVGHIIDLFRIDVSTDPLYTPGEIRREAVAAWGADPSTFQPTGGAEPIQ